MSNEFDLKIDRPFFVLDGRDLDAGIDTQVSAAWLRVAKQFPAYSDRVYMLLCNLAYQCDRRSGIPVRTTIKGIAECVMIGSAKVQYALSLLRNAGIVRIEQSEDVSVTVTVTQEEQWTIGKDAIRHD